MSRKAFGTLLIAISSTAFGSYGYFALKAGQAGIGPFSLLAYRFGIAVAILGLVAALTRGRLEKRQILPLIGLGMLYVGQAFTFLQCLLVSGSPITASLLLYIYPAWVTLGSVLFLREKLTTVKIIALACAFVGSFAIIGPVANVQPAAIVYGVCTSLFFAAYLVCGKKVMQSAPPVMATLTILTTAFLVFGLGALITGIDSIRSADGWIGAVGLAIVATVIAIGALLGGLSRVSPVEAASLSAIEPLVSAIIAITVMGQALRTGHVVGGVLVLTAVLVLAREAASKLRATGER